MYRIGQSQDIHQLVEGRDLILGGVKIPFEKGLLGHSDADVLTHAICEAIIGAAGLGDLGTLYPDTDAKYKGVSSIKLLEDTLKRIKDMGYELVNVDSLVICEAPKLVPYKKEITNTLKKVLKIDAVNVKATTMEKLGPVGKGEAIIAQAIVLLKKGGM